MKANFTITSEQVAARAVHAVRSLDFSQPHEVVIRPKKSSRSLRQNSTFHGWCNEISQKFAEAHGKFYPADHWKEHLKSLLLGIEVIEVYGRQIERTRGTSDLNTAEMAEFMTAVDHYCGSELNIYVTLPGQDY